MFKPYDENMVIPFADQTNQAMQQIENTAGQQFQPFQQAQSQAENVLQSGGITGGMQGGLDAIQGVASGQNQIGTGQQFQNMFTGAGASSNTEKNMSEVAAGSRLNGNEALMEQLGRGADDIAHRVNMEASAMGRGGSVAHTSNMANNLSDYYSDALLADNQFARGEQMQANTALDAQANQRFTNQMGATQGQTQVEGANISNQVGAGQMGFNAGNAANQTAATYAQLAPQMFSNQFSGADRLMQVGALNEDLATREANDEARRFSETNAQDRAQIEWLNAIYSGNGSLGQTGTSTTAAPGTSSFVNGLGGASAGAGIGSMFGPVGTAIGAGVGGIGGWFS